MPRSNYGRFKDGVQISGVNLNVHQKGRVFYVCNSTVLAPGGIGANDSGDGRTPERPFSTLDYAIGQCTANRGDKIIVLPGHAETVSGATTIAMDVAGISIIGMGDGALKPLFSFSATTSNIAVSAANIKVQGIAILATIDSVVAAFTISAPGVEMDIETRDTSAAVEFVSCFVTTSAGDNLKLKARHRGFAAGDAMVRYIDLVGVRDAEIDVDFFGIASVAVVNMRTTACDNIRVVGSFYNESAALSKNVVNSTTSTWSVKGHDAKGGYDFIGSDDSPVTAVNIPDSTGAYVPGLGYRITKTSNLADGSGTDALFTVNGMCEITRLVGEVTTVIGGAATMKIRDVTNSVDLCAATTIDTDAVGTMYLLTGVVAQILNGTGNAPVVGSASGLTGQPNSIIVGNTQAAITLAHVLDDADTGNVLWTLYYQPLASGATVVAAA